MVPLILETSALMKVVSVWFPPLLKSPPEIQQLYFSKIDYDAPVGGLPIEVKTNVPDSVVMPEASIAAGDRTANIPVQGGVPGEGKLIISAPGYEFLEVPVRVF